MAQSSGRARTAGIVLLIGGAILAVGSFLPWFKLSVATQTKSVAGFSASDGKITFAAGVLVVLGGLIVLLGSSGARKGMAVLAIIAGLAGAGVGIYDLTTKNKQIDDVLRKQIKASTGQDATSAQLALAHRFLDRLGFKIDASIGIYLVVLGGLGGLVGGAMAAGAKEPAPSAPAFEPMGGAQPYSAPMSPPPSSMPTPPPAAPSPPPPPGAPPGRDATQFAPPPAAPQDPSSSG